MKTYLKKNQRGRSMIEILGVLAIVGILSAGGIAGYSMAMEHYKTNALIEKIQLIVTQTRSLYKSGYYEGISDQDLIDTGKITDVNNPFGGSLRVRQPGNIETDTRFLIDTNRGNIPAQACTDIVLTDWGGDREFFGIDIIGDETTYLWVSNGNYPATEESAVAACKGGNKRLKISFY